MNKFISMTLAIIMTTAFVAGSSTAFANTSSAMKAKDFPTRKTQILEHINNRITKMQEIQSCVQAANDFQTMRACKPHHKNKHQ